MSSSGPDPSPKPSSRGAALGLGRSVPGRGQAQEGPLHAGVWPGKDVSCSVPQFCSVHPLGFTTKRAPLSGVAGVGAVTIPPPSWHRFFQTSPLAFLILLGPLVDSSVSSCPQKADVGWSKA